MKGGALILGGVTAMRAAQIYQLLLAAAAAGTIAARQPYLDQLRKFRFDVPVTGDLIIRRELGQVAQKRPDLAPQLPSIAAAIGLNDKAAPNAAANGGTLAPPGDCRDDQYSRLDREVTNACRNVQPRKCLPLDSRPALEAKARVFQACIDAREAIMRACFRGGDDGHREQVKTLTSGLQKCLGYMR
jgi:hypothetical protein